MAVSPLLASSVSLVDAQSNGTVDVAQQVGDLSGIPCCAGPRDHRQQLGGRGRGGLV